MPLSRRLADLEKNLELLYKKLGAMERELINEYKAQAKFSIEQEIDDIKLKIREWKAEYWQLLAQEASLSRIDEVDASNAVVEVVQIVERVQQNNANQYPEQVIQLLTEIRNKLNEPGKSSTAKLKATLPLLPPFVSYEMELDLLRQVFPTFSRLFRKAEKEPIRESGATLSERQQQIERQIQSLEAIIADAKYEPNLANIRDRYLHWRKETTNFLLDTFGDKEASNLNGILPQEGLRNDKARLLSQAAQIRNYLITLSEKLS